MKVAVELDYAPVQAKELLEPLSVRPIQFATTGAFEAKMSSNHDKPSPHALFEDCFSPDPGNSERIQDVFASFIARAVKRQDE